MTDLTDKHRDASTGELSDCPSILIQITAGESLVGRVEESEMAFLYHNVGNRAPLVPGRIHSRGVMGAGVENKDRPTWGALKRR